MSVDTPTHTAKKIMMPAYIAIEGCIGVGKTTLTNLLAQQLKSRVVLEVVEENPFLPDFYKDPVLHAFKTQIFFLLSRFKQQEAVLQYDLFENHVCADYIFAKDRIFAELTLSQSELSLYHQVYFALQQRIRSPDLVIYLHAPIEIILERINKRGRDFEKSIDKGYLENLVQAYRRFFSHYQESPLLMVDTSDFHFPHKAEDLEILLQTIQTFTLNNEKRRYLSKFSKETSPSLFSFNRNPLTTYFF